MTFFILETGFLDSQITPLVVLLIVIIVLVIFLASN